MEEFIVASFRSRTQVIYYDKLLKKSKIVSEVISTPKEIAIGCGFSVKIPKESYNDAKKIYEKYRPHSFVGFYSILKDKSSSKITSMWQSRID